MESLAEDLRQMRRTPLLDAHVEAIRSIGSEVVFEAGEIVARAGEPAERFIYVLEGEIEVMHPFTGKRYLSSSLGPTQFAGEISFLSGGANTLSLRATVATRAIVVSRLDLLQLMARIPEMSDIIITVYAARRRRQLDDNDSSLTLLGADTDKNVRQVESFATRNRIPFQSVDLGSKGAKAVAGLCGIPPDKPAVIFGRDTVLSNPSPSSVAKILGLDLSLECRQIMDVLIVGAGPAGVGIGVYYAATESEARFCRDAEVIVIGGGNSAGQAAMYLSRSCQHVHVLVRGKSLAASMSDYLASRLEAHPHISVHFETEVVALHGNSKLESVSVIDKSSGQTGKMNCESMFVMAGAAPNTNWISNLALLDRKGFVLTGKDVGQAASFATSCDGLFAVGDVRAGSVKRVAASVGEGSVVISEMWAYLNH